MTSSSSIKIGKLKWLKHFSLHVMSTGYIKCTLSLQTYEKSGYSQALQGNNSVPGVRVDLTD